MPTTDLSLITSSLITLLKDGMTVLLGSTPGVVAQSPDKVSTSAMNTLSFYLYHIREDPYYKNALPEGGGQGPINRVPLALNLFYVATSHHYADNVPDPATEQKLLSAALKTLHDFPNIDDTTTTPGAAPKTVLDVNLRGNGNHFDVILRPVGPEECISFWNGDDARLIRLSAFYEVRVVLLKPETPTELPGYVLTLGNYIAPKNALYIDHTENEVAFTVPGLEEQTITASPARVPLVDGENSLTIRGSGFSGGQIVLRSSTFTSAPDNQIIVDPALNPLWSVKVTPQTITALAQSTVIDASLGSVDLLPGLYSVSVRVSTTYKLPGGLTKELTTTSNEAPLTLTPFIVSDGGVGGAQPPVPVVLTTSGMTDLTDTALDGAISVVVAGQTYALATNAGDPGIREFKVNNAAQITIGAHFGSDDAGLYPIRLLVRGADAPPYWIEVPA